jgi:hypothetical protein
MPIDICTDSIPLREAERGDRPAATPTTEEALHVASTIRSRRVDEQIHAAVGPVLQLIPNERWGHVNGQ